MSFQLIGAGSDLSSTQTQVNKNILELKNNEVTTFFKDDTGTRRVLMGKGASGFYGLKVSQSGVDVYSAGDDELVFNSDNNVFKIVESGTTSITTPSITNSAVGYYTDQTTVTISHSLGFTPAVIAFTGLTGNNIPLPAYGVISYDATAKNSDYIYTSVSSTEVRIIGKAEQMIFTAGSETAGGNTYNIRYYLLQETAD